MGSPLAKLCMRLLKGQIEMSQQGKRSHKNPAYCTRHCNPCTPEVHVTAGMTTTGRTLSLSQNITCQLSSSLLALPLARGDGSCQPILCWSSKPRCMPFSNADWHVAGHFFFPPIPRHQCVLPGLCLQSSSSTSKTAYSSWASWYLCDGASSRGFTTFSEFFFMRGTFYKSTLRQLKYSFRSLEIRIKFLLVITLFLLPVMCEFLDFISLLILNDHIMLSNKQSTFLSMQTMFFFFYAILSQSSFACLRQTIQ